MCFLNVETVVCLIDKVHYCVILLLSVQGQLYSNSNSSVYFFSITSVAIETHVPA